MLNKIFRFNIGLAFIMSTTTIASAQTGTQKQYQLVVLEPGHFHAALLQKTMYPQISADVHVYAPVSPELKAHLALIDGYNKRPADPTHWNEIVYSGNDYIDHMLQNKAGNSLVVLAGNNKHKTENILRATRAGFNVLSDKPMAIDKAGFEKLKEAFAVAAKKNVLAYDIMTERYDATNIIQRELMLMPDIFGKLEKGTPADPAVVKESVHYFFKTVSGKPLTRPAWYFDVQQEGDGIVDVTTHLVDLVKWTCFPEQIVDYKKDITVTSAKRWPTAINPEQFKKVTQLESYPEFLNKDLRNNVLMVYANGEMNYNLKGTAVKITAMWGFEAPPGTGDTYYSLIKGSKCNFIIRQGAAENYNTVLYVQSKGDAKAFQASLEKGLSKLAGRFPGLSLAPAEKGWKIVIPEKFNIGHEAQFAEVTKKYLEYLQQGQMPAWELSDMISKYYTTVSALDKAVTEKDPRQ